MAVDLTITPSAPPLVVTVPQPGDLRKAASVVLFAQQLADYAEATYRRTRRAQYDITNAPFNADPTGGASSQAAITAAIAAAAATNGDVVVPPGTYLHTGLTVPDGVCVYAAQGAEFFNTDTTSASIVFTQSNEGPPSVIEGIRFHASNPNTGNVITNNADARVIFRRCSFNGYANGGGYFTNLQGKIAATNSALSELTFVDCIMVVGGIVNGLHCTQGKIRVIRGSMKMPATYSASLAWGESTGRVTLDGVYIDLTAHTTGVAQVLYANSSSASAFCAMRGCEIEATGALGTLTAFYWTPDANVVMTGNRMSTTGVDPFGSISAPSSRSFVELREYVQQDFGASASIDLRNTYGYRTHLVRNAAGAVSIILPAGVIDGQELDFIYHNSGAGSVLPAFATTPATGTTVPTIGAGNTLTGHFRWAHRDASGDSDRWIQVGPWGVGTTLV